MIETYTTTLLASSCFLLGGMILKQDRGRIEDLENKQEADHTLLSKIDGKLDVLIELINKNGVSK